MFIKLADGNRAQINEMSLKTRKFIGNTSMEPTLSLLMANQAQVKRGDLVFDPFVGTGSMLVRCILYYHHYYRHQPHYIYRLQLQNLEVCSKNNKD